MRESERRRADEVALALVERIDETGHLVAELERDGSVTRHGLQEEGGYEFGGGRVRYGRARLGVAGEEPLQLAVKQVGVLVAKEVGIVRHGRSEMGDGKGGGAVPALSVDGLRVDPRAVDRVPPPTGGGDEAGLLAEHLEGGYDWSRARRRR